MTFPNTIFCDESGFTGSDLFSSKDPYFVFASVSIDPHVAEDYVRKIIHNSKYNIQNNELKGALLVKYSKGRDIAKNTLEEFSQNTAAYVFDKKFALSAKLFEYIFEPVLSKKSTLFYDIGFNRFISNILYLSFLANEEISGKLLLQFQNTMRGGEFQELYNLLNSIKPTDDLSPIIDGIKTFTNHYRLLIIEELNLLRQAPTTASWVLELSTTALFQLLAHWGEIIESMEVYFDDSKPISAQSDIFNAMINRSDKAYINIYDRKHPLVFNLSQRITSRKSLKCPGIQIADVIASTLNYCLKNPELNFSKECMIISEHFFFLDMVWPDLEFANLNNEKSFVNALLFEELIRRTHEGKDLLAGIEDYIQNLPFAFSHWQLHKQ